MTLAAGGIKLDQRNVEVTTNSEHFTTWSPDGNTAVDSLHHAPGIGDLISLESLAVATL